MQNPVIYLHSSEEMPEIADHSVKLLIGASVFLGRGVGWDSYRILYDAVYNKQGRRVLREDGVLLVVQTNAYMSGKFVCRYKLLLELLFPSGWELIDERVWKRTKANNFQVPFSHVLVFRPPGGTVKRGNMNRYKPWFQGIWDYPQRQGGKLNSWPNELCDLVVNACTDAGDLIVDSYVGTGRVLRIASGLGRLAIGYEINRELIPTLRANGCEVRDGDYIYPPLRKGFFA